MGWKFFGRGMINLDRHKFLLYRVAVSVKLVSNCCYSDFVGNTKIALCFTLACFSQMKKGETVINNAD